MRIVGAEIQSFGHFKNRTLTDLDHPVLCLLGDNETGKTTFFRFLVTMMYGFSPTNLDKHPYAPFDGSILRGRLRFRGDSGVDGVVERQLTNIPKGSWSDDVFAEARSLSNRPLPLVSHISPRIFHSVFAISLRELVGLEGAALDDVRERLLGELNFPHLAPVRKVIEDLRQSGNSLWRPDNRGNPLARKLNLKRSDLRESIRDAKLREERIREVTRQRSELEIDLTELRVERTALREKLEYARTVAPVLDEWFNIQHLRETAGDVDAFVDLPEDPRAELVRLRGGIAEATLRLEEIHSERSRCEEQVKCYGQAEQRRCELAQKVRCLAADRPGYEADVARRDVLVQGAADDERLLTSIGSRLFAVPLDPPLRDVAAEIDVARTAELVRIISSLQGEIGFLKRRPPELWMSRATPAMFLAFCAFGLTIAGLVLSEDTVTIGGFVAMVAAAVTGLVVQFAVRRERVSWQARLSGHERDLEMRHRELDQALAPVLLHDVWRDDPDDRLVMELARVSELLTKMRAEAAEREVLGVRISEFCDRLGDLSAEFGVVQAGNASYRVGQLEEERQRCESTKVLATQSMRAANVLEEDEERVVRSTRDQQQLMESLETRLSDLGNGDSGAGARVLAERRRAGSDAEIRERGLFKRHPDTERVVRAHPQWKPTAESGASLADQIRDIEAAIDRIDDSVERLNESVREHRVEIDSLLSEPSVDELEGEKLDIESELAEVRFRRDRLTLLQNIVKLADHRFRAAHQPDILKRTNEFLERFTMGSLGTLMFDERTDGLAAVPRDHSMHVPVEEPLSQGTRDQVYLALRLAIAEHLDASAERLPLFFDEVLVNWSEDRRRAAYPVLTELSGHRQVVFFTCHPWLASELARFADAQVVPMLREERPVAEAIPEGERG